MATNLNLDDKLVGLAQKVGHHKTKREAVSAALKEYIAHKKQIEITNLFNNIDFDNTYDYKRSRQR